MYCRVRPAKGADEATQTFAFLDDRSMEATAAPEKNALGKAKAEGRKWNFQVRIIPMHVFVCLC